MHTLMSPAILRALNNFTCSDEIALSNATYIYQLDGIIYNPPINILAVSCNFMNLYFLSVAQLNSGFMIPSPCTV